MTDAAQTARDALSRALANRRVATLDARPFLLTAAQLAWVDGGDLVEGQEDGPLTRIVAGRYASLFADHVIGDISADGAPGAYIRMLSCAREAFLKSLSIAASSAPTAPQCENEGAATLADETTVDATVGASDEHGTVD